MIKRYTQLSRLKAFKERFDYLKLDGSVGNETFGSHRYLNQRFYKSREWRRARREVILRDDGCDLGHPDRPILGEIYIHHLNPITLDDILERKPCVFDPENLVCVSFKTHNAIHYGGEDTRPEEYVERQKNDTCPWR